MKALLPQVVAGLLLTAVSASAQFHDVQITAQRQRLDQQKERTSNTTVTTNEIVYDVTVQSRTFKDLTNLVVKYMIFFEEPQPGSAAKPKESSKRGQEKIATLERSRSISFKTETIKLVTEDLDAGWYYSSGGGNRAKDKVNGVWIRAYDAEGKIVGEYANPTTVTKKFEWKD